MSNQYYYHYNTRECDLGGCKENYYILILNVISRVVPPTPNRVLLIIMNVNLI